MSERRLPEHAALAPDPGRNVRDVEDLRALKEQPGKHMHAVRGATLVSSLINAGLVDELRIVVQPIVLGRGKTLFRDVKETPCVALTLLDVKPLQSPAPPRR